MRRTYWASGTALAIVIAFLYLFFNADNSGKPMQSFLKASSSAEEGSAAKVKVSSGVDGAGEMPMENKLTKEEMIEAMVAGSNRQVDFYGEIVDQHGDAVPGVEVTCSLNCGH